jgi:hypothetical protein
MNQNGFPRQYPIHPIVDIAPPTWDRGSSHSARSLLHLLPYPRSRRHDRAVLRSHVGSGSVPGARGSSRNLGKSQPRGEAVKISGPLPVVDQ